MNVFPSLIRTPAVPSKSEYLTQKDELCLLDWLKNKVNAFYFVTGHVTQYSNVVHSPVIISK